MSEIESRSSTDIARAVGRLVTSGRLQEGTLLPPVRVLGSLLGVSPMTVSQAWRLLVADGLIETRGRAGTVVAAAGSFRPSARRRSAAAPATSPVSLDLSSGTPDRALLPDIGPALSRVSRQAHATSYQAASMLPELETLMRRRWPFKPDALMVVNGAGDALERIVSLLVRCGSRVVVEEATYPPLLDLLEQAGAEPIGVVLDDEGVVPAALQSALTKGPVACIFQPRAQNPTGVSMTAERARQLAAVLAASSTHDVVVVEDDHAGDISVSPPVSIGSFRAHATIRIESFSKSHGPDLRLAAVGGAGPVMRALEERRALGPGWSSRLLQQVLVELLGDPAAVAAVRRARRLYAKRRRAFVAALAARGVVTTGGDGINLWVEVADEDHAIGVLAAAGIGAARGRPFLVERDGEAVTRRPHIRLTVGLVGGDPAAMGAVVAEAAGPPPRRTFR
jgi:DNA-binding transcriptional MocR family regulator